MPNVQNWLAEKRGIDHVEKKIIAIVYINGNMFGYDLYRMF